MTAPLALECAHYRRGDCRSCGLLEVAYPQQLADKLVECRELVDPARQADWLQPVAGPTAAFRNKAKMAVSGRAGAPVLGLADANGLSVDLVDCPLYPADMRDALAVIAEFVAAARIEPYAIARRDGELKFVLLTRAAGSGELMLRFVLRSRAAIATIASALPRLRARLPALRVVSANIQPRPMAIVEGDEEIGFDGPARLAIDVNDVPLRLAPGSFWQTNDTVAAALYRQVRAWCDDIRPAALWDLYCGVGGFALHGGNGERAITGVEVSAAAIDCARISASAMGEPRARFIVGDATEFAESQPRAAPLVIVNPPRRGFGERLGAWINASDAEWLVYSSCNAASLAADLARLPRWRLQAARLFDMFPHTRHYEVAALLRRNG